MRFTRFNSGQFSAVHYTNKLLNANCPFGIGVLRLYFGKSFTGEASLIERTEFSFLHVPQYILKWRTLDEASWQKCFLSHTTLPQYFVLKVKRRDPEYALKRDKKKKQTIILQWVSYKQNSH